MTKHKEQDMKNQNERREYTTLSKRHEHQLSQLECITRKQYQKIFSQVIKKATLSIAKDRKCYSKPRCFYRGHDWREPPRESGLGVEIFYYLNSFGEIVPSGCGVSGNGQEPFPDDKKIALKSFFRYRSREELESAIEGLYEVINFVTEINKPKNRNVNCIEM